MVMVNYRNGADVNRIYSSACSNHRPGVGKDCNDIPEVEEESKPEPLESVSRLHWCKTWARTDLVSVDWPCVSTQRVLAIDRYTSLTHSVASS